MGVMCGGGEMTREDMIIYGEATGKFIDDATDDIMRLAPLFQRFQVRTILERLVYKSILEIEENGPW